MTKHPSTVRYFNGKISKAHTAHIYPSESVGAFVLVCDDVQAVYHAQDYEFLPSVGNAPAVLRLSDGGRIEILGKPPTWLHLTHERLFDKVSHMERSFGWILVSLALVCGFMFGVLKFGIPLASHHIAHSLPADTLNSVGNQAESHIMDLTTPSTLPQARQDEIIALYDELDAHPKAKIVVRGGGNIGANALAIPNNTIIITDELIRLSDDNHEILAVLAHEQGHLVYRHSLEQAISRLGLGVLIVVITGDASDMLLTLPTLLTTAQYSQQAEMQADKFAIDELQRLGISPAHLVSFFEKLKKEHGDTQGHWSMLSTHPDTDKRIEQAKQHEH